MATIIGTSKSDFINMSVTSAGVRGGPATDGADVIRSRQGDDEVHAGGGNDTIDGENGADRLWGDAGRDLIHGGNGDDQIHGGADTDRLYGDNGSDRLWGDAGDDLLWGGHGTDEAVYAGTRSNYEVLANCDGSVTVRDLNGAADGLDEGTDTLAGIERLRFEGGGSGSIVLASTSSTGEQANASSSAVSLSADGGKVAFQTEANNLVPGDTNAAYDIFVKDLMTGELTRASASASGEEGNGHSYEPALFADGSKVIFGSWASNLVADDTNATYDIFVKDLLTGEVTRVSTSVNGEQANGDSYALSLSADGNKVAFLSFASNLVPDDTNGAQDVFVKDLLTGEVTLASASASGEQQNDRSWNAPSLSADGSKVAFMSFVSNLVPNDTNGAADIFVKDLATGEIIRASTSATGEEANNNNHQMSLSADGSKVAFESAASNLVPDDINGQIDIFVKDLFTGQITRASTSSNGEETNGGSYGPALSADGSKVAFESWGPNLVPGDTNGDNDIFVKDLATGQITRVSTSAGGEEGNGGSVWPSLSFDGTKVAFISGASNLVPGGTNGLDHVYVKELSSGPAVYAINHDGSLEPLTGSMPPLDDHFALG